MEKLNRTVKRTIDILMLLKTENRPLTCKEISQCLDMPLTSTFDIVRTLLSEEFIEYANEAAKSYVIGPRCFEAGMAYSSRASLLTVARPYEEKLMHMCNATSFVAGAYKNKILYLDKIEAPTSVRTSAELGSRADMYCSGLGKSILATYSAERVAEIFNETNVVTYTDYTLTTLPALMEDLKKTRERGYAVDNREANINVYCMAAPIRDHSGHVIAAISVATLYDDEIEKHTDEYGRIIASYAREISHKIGYYGELYI